jgi:hypothetical protein
VWQWLGSKPLKAICKDANNGKAIKKEVVYQSKAAINQIW